VTRTKLAFWLAPLCVPLVIAPWLSFVVFPSSPFWVSLGTTLSVLISYAAMFALGLPAYRYFESRGLLRLWIALIYGFVSAQIAALFFFTIMFPMLLGEAPLSNLPSTLSLTLKEPSDVLAPGLLGVMVVLVFWATARPNRTAR
jgi:hypothetical protein